MERKATGLLMRRMEMAQLNSMEKVLQKLMRQIFFLKFPSNLRSTATL